MAKLVTIYALSDPRLDRVWENVRYVGKTEQSLRTRLSGHMCVKNSAHKSCWIKSIEAEGLMPAIWPLAFSSQEDWPQEEVHWISKLRLIGNLTNVSDGGLAGAEWTPELRRKLKERLKTRKPRPPFSATHCERIRAKAIGRQPTPESIERRRLKLIGKKRSPEIREKFRLAQLARPKDSWKPLTEEHKSKIAAAHIGLGVPDYAREKISIANSIPVMRVDTGEIFRSAVAAAKSIGVTSTSIKRACGKNIPCHGLMWKQLPKQNATNNIS